MTEWDFVTGPRGLRLRICEWGEPGGAPLVVLHGFLEQGAAWHEVASAIPGRRVLAPDQRGHGRSEHVGAGGFYHFWDYVADLDALVRHLGGPIDLLGHSMGGTVASLYAGARPEAVRRLVLVEGLGPPDLTGQAVERARAFLDHLAAPRTHTPVADLDDAVKRMRQWNATLPEESARRLARRVLRDEGQLAWTWDPLHRARSPTPFDATLHRRFLREITAPTLLVDGEISWFQVPDRAERQAELRHARRVLVPGAGHLVHHDAPTALAAQVTAHLDGPG